MKVIKRHGSFIELVKLDKPVLGGSYAVISSGKITDGLCLDAARDLFATLKKLSR